ncbi:MAG: rane protein insertase YidC [Actinomycetota bacterium]|jgi:YidC/Oxa1 family membrane protein insertase
MDIISLILFPFKWILEAILVLFHSLFTTIGLNADAGVTWVLSIIGLVLVVRAALIPLFVKQIRSQRAMYVLQPDLQKLQKKYKGRKDRDSRERMAKEQMELYKKHGSSPFASCLPLIAQMPVFFSLYATLTEAQNSKPGVGLLSKELSVSFASADFVGARLSETFINGASVSGQILAGIMIILMSASQFITQKQIMAKNQNPDVQNSQFVQTQKILLYVFPLIFLVTGLAFPLGVLIYWTVSNFWTMGQQFFVIRRMPTPGSIAHKEREARLVKKGKIKIEEPTVSEQDEEKPTQRVQPVSKARAKKKPKGKK